MKGITVQELLENKAYGFELEVIAGSEGLSKKIYNPRIQKLGLIAAGFMVYLHPHRVQILGNTEISFLRQLGPEERGRIISELCRQEVVCFIVTRNLKVPEEMLREADERRIPLLRTKLVSSTFIDRIMRYLEEELAPSTVIHGVLMEIMGVGVLMIGRSGIGKSENALELIMRGHRLVSDDAIQIKKMAALDLVGDAPEMIKNLLEVRGVGIVDIRHLFGVSAVRDRTKIELVVELVDWDKTMEYERIGLKDEKYRLLGIDLPLVRIPVSPGRNASTIVELACRNHVLKMGGVHTARDLDEKILDSMQRKDKP
ncbi:MAG TPA: HPr(Ser) kinase/phosphatase [Syntrophorhabdales bacterium]|nr:HPr(Ser) kinase/phosphatase [Syntrophorhabdales bacterium]